MKHLLVFGYGSKAGAWKIRGEQLGAAIGARVVNGLGDERLLGIDLAVAVKRPRPADLARLRSANIPVVWDVVDAWHQPIGNWWGKDECMKWLKGEVKRIQPIGMVVATHVMAEDCAAFGLPVIVLPHHARPGLERTPIREHVTSVGYEGGEHYLGRWQVFLKSQCEARKWVFVINPGTINALDIVVAVREQNGYAARHWKSNIKLANAQGSGTPCVMNRERAYLDTQSGGEFWADTTEEMEDALEALRERKEREAAAEKLFRAAPHVEELGVQYQQWLEAL